MPKITIRGTSGRGHPPRIPVAMPVIDCSHRGPVIDRREADLCGLRGRLYDVHACPVHGECVVTRTCHRQQEACCVTCSDRQDPASD